MSDLCPVYAPFFSAMVSCDWSSLGDFVVTNNRVEQGCTSAIVFTCGFLERI